MTIYSMGTVTEAGNCDTVTQTSQALFTHTDMSTDMTNRCK